MLHEYLIKTEETKSVTDLLTDNSDILHFRKGQYIFNEGSTPIGIYIVQSGKVKMSQFGSDGKEQIVRMAISGEILSITELFTGARHTSSAKTLEDTTLQYISRHDILDLVWKQPALFESFLHLLSLNLQQAEEKITAMAYKPVRGRLADALVVLSEKFNTNHDQTQSLLLTRSDLASFVGTAKETVNRLLSEFRKDKLVRTEGTRIHILNRNGLKRLSRMYD